jgi:hypothetical protein
MVDNVLYICGAGFSAPLGLPVMSNFLSRSKDIYYGNRSKYKYFQDVYDVLDGPTKIKNYFHCDLGNIEEVLSILEVDALINGTGLRDEIINFICDVIREYTPPLEIAPNMPGNWQGFIFGQPGPWRGYLDFVGNLLRAKMHRRSLPQKPFFEWSLNNEINYRYAVVTFNYDLVFETCINAFVKTHNSGSIFDPVADDERWSRLKILKLHGTVDNNQIIPPTWNKTSYPRVGGDWKEAHELIKEAQHIRFIGYSLPVTDSYATYFLKASIGRSQHLKSIDAIVLDPTGEVKRRYEELISFRPFRFFNISCQQILDRLTVLKAYARMDLVTFDDLETVTSSFSPSDV